METRIELKSREEHNYLRRLTSVAHTNDVAYLLVTSFEPVKGEILPDGRKKIKPRGSTPLIEGEMPEDINAVIKELIHTQQGWVVVFKVEED